MARSSWTGPLMVNGGDTTNPDQLAPNSLAWGYMLPDPRSPNLLGQQSAGWLPCGSYIVVDATPTTKSTSNIAAAANVTSGTAMTLVSSSGSGAIVLATPYVSPFTGLTVPTGAVAMVNKPAVVNPSVGGNILVLDPTTALSRCVTVTGVSSGAGGNFLIKGYDLYGVPMSQLLTVGAGASTGTTTKAFKFVTSVVPQFTDAHNYSVGDSDTFGLPLFSSKVAYTTFYWNSAIVTSNAGYTAGVTTSPATTTTGDTRGTYTVQTASDGTKTLQMFLDVAPANAFTTAGLIGVTQV